MRLVVQRVLSASVSTNGKVVGGIDKGLFVLVGIKKGDTEASAERLLDKLAKLRVMSDTNDKMNLTSDTFLVVSQFTLYANTKDGNRPSFVEAEEPGKAKILYDCFVNRLKEKNVNVQTGSFGDYMEIKAELDGPVTIVLET